jgi:hypothetical protein
LSNEAISSCILCAPPCANVRAHAIQRSLLTYYIMAHGEEGRALTVERVRGGAHLVLLTLPYYLPSRSLGGHGHVPSPEALFYAGARASADWVMVNAGPLLALSLNPGRGTWCFRADTSATDPRPRWRNSSRCPAPTPLRPAGCPLLLRLQNAKVFHLPELYAALECLLLPLRSALRTRGSRVN